jgi:hypothetical protein
MRKRRDCYSIEIEKASEENNRGLCEGAVAIGICDPSRLLFCRRNLVGRREISLRQPMTTR